MPVLAITALELVEAALMVIGGGMGAAYCIWMVVDHWRYRRALERNLERNTGGRK